MRALFPLFVLILLSSFSAWLDTINVLTVIGYEMQSTPTLVGCAGIAGLLPHFLFSGHFSAVALHFTFQRVLAITLAGRTLASLALIFAPNVYSVIVILFFRSLMVGYMQPAVAFYIAKVQTDKNVAAIISLINSSSKIVAPAIGGVFSVTTGEKTAFAVSAAMSLLGLCLVLFVRVPLSTTTAARKKQKHPVKPQLRLPVSMVCFSLPIIFIEGLSNFFSNIIPFTFNHFDIPKLTLSLALTCSAAGNLIAGAYMVKRSTNTSFPTRAIFSTWLTHSLLFAILTTSLLFNHINFYLIPMVFFGLSVTKTYYDIHLNSFIYTNSSEIAASLAAKRQSIMAVAGISITLVATSVMEILDPLILLYSVLGLSMLSGVVWLKRIQKEESPVSNKTEPVHY